MVGAANQQAYGGSPYGTNTWGSTPPPIANGWNGPPFWYPLGLSRPLGIAAMILGFVFWWPVGLALLFLMKWSGHMGCWGRRQRAMYANGGYDNAGWQGPFQGWAPWKGWNAQGNAQSNATQPQAGAPSGNRAFDEYRAETLRRLEDEQREFGSFLERLRFAKDKAEFDQFMSERRERPVPPVPPENSPHP
jgi:hypothetical protein